MASVYFFGDVHGYRDRLVKRLRDASLVDGDGRWIGKDGRLIFMGDFMDRGPNGIETLEFVMTLQEDARRKGGTVESVMGNHEAGLISVKRLGTAPSLGRVGTFEGDWIGLGGKRDELERVSDRHMAWITALPALILVNDELLVGHSDSLFTLRYGRTIEEVNAAVRRLVMGNDDRAWGPFVVDFFERYIFWNQPAEVEKLFEAFGGHRFIHGHTTIPKLSGADPETVVEALSYADGRCVDVDGGMYSGGPGFVHQEILGEGVR